MTTADGTVLGTTQIVDGGSPTTRWTLVFLSEGYQSGQMGQYATDAQNAAETILDTTPFSERRPVIDVFRIDVTSTDSGADDPTACVGGSGATPRTYFDASFCGQGIRRALHADAATALSVADAQVPQWDAVLMIVNSTVYGGTGGAIGVFSLAANTTEIALHELGHTAFGLADEYDYFKGCNSGETNRDHHPSTEPAQPNVTVASTRTTIKWASLILPTTPVPTTSNPDCTKCDPQPSPVPTGRVGAFEGADHYHCDAYRPEYRCKMFDLGQPFCRVCQQRILQILPGLPTTVPWVQELHAAVAANLVRASGLVPKFTGPSGSGAWVWHQSPRGGRVVSSGSLVTMQLRTGPIP